VIWGRTPPDGSTQNGTAGPGERSAQADQAAWLAREVARLAEDNDRLRVALEDLTESLAWRYVVRSNRGLNRDERAAVDHALVILTDEPQLGAPDRPAQPLGASTHPSASAAPSQEGPPRLRLLK
jgi:hypothetical protein